MENVRNIECRFRLRSEFKDNLFATQTFMDRMIREEHHTSRRNMSMKKSSFVGTYENVKILKRYCSQKGYDTKNLQFRENAESPMMPDNKTYICHKRTSLTNPQTILFLLAFFKQNYYLRIKYIISKSSSLKYNEIFHQYLYLIKELSVYRNTSLGPAVW